MVEKLPQKIHIGFSLLGTIGGIIGFIILTCLGNIHAGKCIILQNIKPIYKIIFPFSVISTIYK